MDEEVGLRELKKQMTREAIADAALRLTVEKGLSNVTLDDIAREAFVSARTVSNYFPSKEEAVLAAGSAGTSRIIEEFTGEPTDDPPLQALCQIVSDYAREHPRHLRQAAQMVELEEDNPTLRPFRAGQFAELQDILRRRIAGRTGRDADTDLYPTLTASAAAAAMTTAITHWFHAGAPDEQLPEILQEAFNIVSGGYRHEPAPTLATDSSAGASATTADSPATTADSPAGAPAAG